MPKHSLPLKLWPSLCVLLGIVVLILVVRGPRTEVLEKIKEVPVIQEKVVKEVVEKIVEVEKPDPILGLSGETDLQRTSRGFTFRSEVEVENGTLASLERKSRGSYIADYRLRVKVPKAAASLDELESSTPGLASLFPGLGGMVAKASVSDFYEKLYANKIKRLEANAEQIGSLLTKHNFFDCQTMLNLTAENGRKVFLMQGDMDVVSDGSDGDRLPEMPDEIVNSTYYQPTTSYGWAKVGDTPNPLIAGYEKRIRVARGELADPSVSAERKTWVRGRINNLLEPGIEEMKRRSFLIAEYDPFIVIPMDIIVNRQDPWAPHVGDYAVVIHDGVVYPAICGDAGPTFKVGEASLRMARQIDDRSSPYRRPVSDLTVTYICFPGTAEKPHRPPDYEFWRSRCLELLEEMGGVNKELFIWEDLLASDEESGEDDTSPASE
ncbi:MAG: glycoside hydrolase family 75 protein [Verrucomicrobiota bacterium JB023]|nr:glycoside hydrolase family 75 protein [Verrucomicrobiota bacterium JB023]